MDIGIIGGADGPTKIFLTSNINQYKVALIFICIAVVVTIIFTIKKRRK